MSVLHHAFRSLLRSPGFTAAAVSTLALCLAANLAIFAVVDAILLHPLPFPDADRLVSIYNTYPRAGVARDGASLTNYFERRGQLSAFSALAEVRADTALVGEPGTTERVDTARITPDFFATLDVAPALGRSFTEAELTPGTDDAVILTDAYWRQHFQADPAVLGRTLRVYGTPRRIVGVLAPDFRFLSSTAQLYFPLASGAEDRGPAGRHSGNSITMVARLAPGFTLAQAQAQIDAQNDALAASYPQAQMIADAGFRSVVVSLHGDHVAAIRPMLLLLQGGVLVLLLIGGVNLVNLLLVRAVDRSKELAVRQSMGATWWHLVRQLLAETGLLALAGGAGGLLLAAFSLDVIRSLGADQLPLGAQIVFDARLALIALAAAGLVGLLLALPVAWFNLRANLADVLHSSSRSSTGSRTARRLQQGAIVAQLALAFVLLSGAGLLAVSLAHLQAVAPGFRADHALAGELSLPGARYGGAAYLDFTDRLTTALAREPGVAAVGLATTLPLRGPAGLSAIDVPDHSASAGAAVRGHYTYGVAGDYFAALGIPLREGRFLTSADSRRPERTCVVDAAFARRYWPEGRVLGQRLFAGSEAGRPEEAFTVVGVVDTVKQTDLAETDELGTVYFPLGYRSDLQIHVVARTTLPPAALAPALRAAVRRLDPELPLVHLQPFEARVADSLVARRSPALLGALFAAIALLLAAVGAYGVLSYAVTQRQREIGVRLALGAPPARIGRQFLTLGLRLFALSLGLGLGGAWLAGHALQSLLFQLPVLHPATLAATAATLGTITLLACWLPARRAARVDPMIALRAE